MTSACRSTATKDPQAETAPKFVEGADERTQAPAKAGAAAGSNAPKVLDPSVYDRAPPEADSAVLASSASPSPAASPSASAPRTRVHVVALMGDSLTDPRAHGGKYVDLLRQKCPESRFDNFAKGGEMVNQMRRRFDRDVFAGTKTSYTDVVFFGGVNDLYSDLTAGRTVEKISADLSTMYGIARDHGARVIAITVSPWGGFTRYFNPSRSRATVSLNRWIHEQKEEGRVQVVVDAYSLLSCENAERLCPEYTPPFNDGLHFGRAAHERLGEALFELAFADCR